jgi:dienelactone hydrolase
MLTILVLFLAPQDPGILAPEEQPRKILYKFLEAECGKRFDERRKTVALLKTEEDIRKRQAELRAQFILALGGFPERTPLRPRVVGTLQGDGFRIEKVIYESRPDHFITANFYIPDGKGPFPGVLLPCGHSDAGKAEKVYQSACTLLAKNGLAVLIYDPIGQGERMQLLDESGKPVIKGTTEHTMVEVGALLVGWSTATFRIWDGIRSLDYLASRPEVDPQKLGCTGNSGGGTMTAYLMALDDRIACAAPSCYVTTLERLFATIGPQDGEQNITGQVSFGMEQTDYVTMRAPKPTLMCVATQDFFDIQGAWTTFREAKRIYGMLGHSERMDLIEYNDKHGFSKPRREAAMRWMRRWLLGIDDAPVEVESPTLKEEDLWCTPHGQVMVDLKGQSVFDLVASRARELDAARGRLSPGDVRRGSIFGFRALEKTVSQKSITTESGNIGTPVVWRSSSGLAFTGAVFGGPDPARRPVVVLSGQGNRREAEKKALEGNPGVVVDLPGIGDTAPEEKPGPFGKDWKEAFLALHLGTSLLGVRTECLQAILSPDPPDLLVGYAEAAPVALHAASLEPRVKAVEVEGMILSWSAVAQSPQSRNQLGSVVPLTLGRYDLPDLAASLAPRPLTIRNPVDALGRPVSQAEAEKAYRKVRDAYKAKNAEKNFTLEAAP